MHMLCVQQILCLIKIICNFDKLSHLWSLNNMILQNLCDFGRPNLNYTWKNSCSTIFPTKLIVQTERVHPREHRKNIIWWVIWCLGVQMFFPNFFPVFSKVKFFAFLYLLTYQGDFNFFSFSANLGCILPIKIGFGHIFHGLWVGASTQPFGPVPGPKSKNKCWYLKG